MESKPAVGVERGLIESRAEAEGHKSLSTREAGAVLTLLSRAEAVERTGSTWCRVSSNSNEPEAGVVLTLLSPAEAVERTVSTWCRASSNSNELEAAGEEEASKSCMASTSGEGELA